jgi:hypothetical protein
VSIASLLADATVEPAGEGSWAGDPQADVIVVLAGGEEPPLYFPTWTGNVRPAALISGILVERNGCLFLELGDGNLSLILWEEGYRYRDGTLYDAAGDAVVTVGQTLHGGGGHFEDPSHLVDEPVPERCLPEGSEPYVMLYDVAPGPYEE